MRQNREPRRSMQMHTKRLAAAGTREDETLDKMTTFTNATSFLHYDIRFTTFTIFAQLRRLPFWSKADSHLCTRQRWHLQRMYAQYHLRPLTHRLKSNHSKSQRNAIQRQQSFARAPETHPHGICVSTSTIGAGDSVGESGTISLISAPPPQTGTAPCCFLVSSS